MRRKISAHVNGGLSGGSWVRRPGSEDPHRRERKFWYGPAIREHLFQKPHPIGRHFTGWCRCSYLQSVGLGRNYLSDAAGSWFRYGMGWCMYSSPQTADLVHVFLPTSMYSYPQTVLDGAAMLTCRLWDGAAILTRYEMVVQVFLTCRL